MSIGKPFDIRVYKRRLRERYKAYRKSLSTGEKVERDTKIFQRVTSMYQYRRCKTLLCYVSTPSEVDTIALIQRAWADKKQVAVPYCLPDKRHMHFYIIKSMEDLEPRTFGVLEPIIDRCYRLVSFKNSLCILPGLSFDRYGYRLGYGGGYYDRFLSKIYRGPTAGICYQACTRPHLIHGRYDVPCQYVVTESGIRSARDYYSRPNRRQ